MTIEEYSNRIKGVDLLEVVKDSINENEDAIIFMNQMQLYNESENQEGFKLRTYNSILYALEKNQRNKGPGLMHPDLYDTGAFYRAFFVKVDKTSFEIDSRDSKSPMLKEKYGEKIFGLNDEHLGILSKDYIMLALIKKIFTW